MTIVYKYIKPTNYSSVPAVSTLPRAVVGPGPSNQVKHNNGIAGMILRSYMHIYLYIHYTRFRRAVLSHQLSRVWVEARVPRGEIKEIIIIIQKNNKEESSARETRPDFIHYNILYKM